MSAEFDLLPLVVGVTGHRDPPKEAEGPVRDRFREVLRRLQREHPSTRLLVLSGLAAGADLWAAEEALACGVDVMGSIPMPQADYERDFTPDDVERFRRVLPRCSSIVVVGTSEKRAQNYVDVADFIAYYCHVLVAFWDGLPARGPGGTAEVVEFRISGVPSVIGDALITYMPDVGPVYQIVTPRRDQPPPADSYALHELYPKRAGWDTKTRIPRERVGEHDFKDAIEHLERFNRDLARERPPDRPDRLAALCDRTDAAANRQQTQTLRSLQSLYVVTALAGAAQLVLPTDGAFGIPSWAGIAARIGLLAIAFVVFSIARRSDYENRYQDYRAIAEALRVQHAWSSAGLQKRLVEASYLQMQQSELEWIRLALRTAYLITADLNARTDEAREYGESMRWIDGQLKYYEAAGERELAHLRRAGVAMSVMVAAGIALSGAAVLLTWALSHQWVQVPSAQAAVDLHRLAYWTSMPVALGSLLALLTRFYSQQRGFTENARRYHHMFMLFDAARRRLRDRGGDTRTILEQLGHEALSEHADWLILHRERPLAFLHT